MSAQFTHPWCWWYIFDSTYLCKLRVFSLRPGGYLLFPYSELVRSVTTTTHSLSRGRDGPSRQPYWIVAKVIILRWIALESRGKYVNHCFIIVLFPWSSSTYNAHINNSGQDSHTKTFELLFQPRLEACSYNNCCTIYFTICFTICNTNHETISHLKLAWDGYQSH